MENTHPHPPGIVGTWSLRTCVIRPTSGGQYDLFGDDLAGVIIYLDNGQMSVHVADQSRPRFALGDFLLGSQEEMASAYGGYISYFGQYECRPDEGVVLHHITASLFPNWTGITHRRYFQINGDKLLITTPPVVLKGEECVMELTWQRQEGA